MKVINLKNYGVIVINTKLTKEAILKLTKHVPSALVLRDEEGNELFKVGFGSASVSHYGVIFDKEDSEGKALVTIQRTMDNKEIAEEYAAILANLKEIEDVAIEAYEALEATLLEIENSIETMEVAPEENPTGRGDE